MRGPVSSCTTPVSENMVIHTETPKVIQVRQTALKLILVNHQGDCLTCYKNLQCELQKAAQYLGVTQEQVDRLRKGNRRIVMDGSHPAFDRDHVQRMSLCAGGVYRPARSWP